VPAVSVEGSLEALKQIVQYTQVSYDSTFIAYCVLALADYLQLTRNPGCGLHRLVFQ
jgi:hypothetical protein